MIFYHVTSYSASCDSSPKRDYNYQILLLYSFDSEHQSFHIDKVIEKYIFITGVHLQ